MNFLKKSKRRKMAFINAINLIIMAMIIVLTAGSQASAQAIDSDLIGLPYAENLELGDTDPRNVAVNIIKVLIGFMAIIVVMLIMLGGFKWMISSGNEDRLAEAKSTISSAIIGLIIILAAWGITNFLLSSILAATTQ